MGSDFFGAIFCTKYVSQDAKKQCLSIKTRYSYLKCCLINRNNLAGEVFWSEAKLQLSTLKTGLTVFKEKKYHFEHFLI